MKKEVKKERNQQKLCFFEKTTCLVDFNEA